MNSQLLTLTIPSAIVLALLVFHSLEALGRKRAAAFWFAVTLYGFLRAKGVELVTERIGASFPYVFHQARLKLGGVPLQEIGGWAIVAYVAWWLGSKLTSQARVPRIFDPPPERGAEIRIRTDRVADTNHRDTGARVAAGRRTPELPGNEKNNPYLVSLWAAVFLATISLAVETAAIAAEWWHWTIPARTRLFGRVPAIGLVDWGFVSFDFILPFILLSSGGGSRTSSSSGVAQAPAASARFRPLRFLSLLLFPVHFGSHLFLEPLRLPHSIPPIHLVHWFVPITILWLASGTKKESNDAFTRGRDTLPLLGISIVLADIALVIALVVRQPELLVALAPVVALILFSLRPVSGWIAGGAGALAGLATPTALLTLVPPVAGSLLLAARRRRWAVVTCLAAGMVAVAYHAIASIRRQELIVSLDRAVAARDRGRISDAVYVLENLRSSRPTEHAPRALLAEIYYQTGRTSEARDEHERIIEIKADHLPSYRSVAAIALQQGDASRAQAAVRSGLAIAPDDLQLLYLQERLGSSKGSQLADGARTPQELENLAALAFEVNDLEGAAAFLDRAIARWSDERKFYQLRARITYMQRDHESLRLLVDQWLERMPDDPEAKALAARLRRPARGE